MKWIVIAAVVWLVFATIPYVAYGDIVFRISPRGVAGFIATGLLSPVLWIVVGVGLYREFKARKARSQPPASN